MRFGIGFEDRNARGRGACCSHAHAACSRARALHARVHCVCHVLWHVHVLCTCAACVFQVPSHAVYEMLMRGCTIAMRRVGPNPNPNPNPHPHHHPHPHPHPHPNPNPNQVGWRTRAPPTPVPSSWGARRAAPRPCGVVTPPLTLTPNLNPNPNPGNNRVYPTKARRSRV